MAVIQKRQRTRLLRLYSAMVRLSAASSAAHALTTTIGGLQWPPPPPSSLELVECAPFLMLVEDDMDNVSTFTYGVCAPSNANLPLVYITDTDLVEESLRDGDHVTLAVVPDDQPPTAEGGAHATTSTARPLYAVQNQQPRRLVSVIQRSPPTIVAGQPAIASSTTTTLQDASTTSVMDLLILRLEYTDATPSYCDEACAINGLYQPQGTNPSVATTFYTSSYGRLRLQPQASTRVLTIQMGTLPPHTRTQHTAPQCPTLSLTPLLLLLPLLAQVLPPPHSQAAPTTPSQTTQYTSLLHSIRSTPHDTHFVSTSFPTICQTAVGGVALLLWAAGVLVRYHHPEHAMRGIGLRTSGCVRMSWAII